MGILKTIGNIGALCAIVGMLALFPVIDSYETQAVMVLSVAMGAGLLLMIITHGYVYYVSGKAAHYRVKRTKQKMNR